jgi:tetratricopeptide (TPR) repeat protein
MDERKIVVVIISLITLLFAGKCTAGTMDQLADADNYLNAKQFAQAETLYRQMAAGNSADNNSLAVQKRLIILYTDWNKTADANMALHTLVSRFAGNPTVVTAVCELATRYRVLGKNEIANKLYWCVADNWPRNEQAMQSLFSILSSNLSLQDDHADRSAVERLLTNFKDNEITPRQLFSIGNEYRKLERYDKACQFYQYVSDNWPNMMLAVYVQRCVVELNLIKGDDAGTQAAIKTLMTRFSGSSYMPEAVSAIAELSKKLNKYDKLDAFYQFTLDTAGQGEFTLWPLVGKATTAIESGNDANVTKIVTQLRTQYSSHPYIANALLLVAEAYYTAGVKNQNRERFEQSVALLEKDVLQNLTQKASAYYILGLNYDQLGDYTKAAQAFENSYMADSNFIHAGYCVIAQEYCYGRLVKTGKITEQEAKEQIKAVYSKLAAEYPAGSSIPKVQKWLQDNK